MGKMKFAIISLIFILVLALLMSLLLREERAGEKISASGEKQPLKTPALQTKATCGDGYCGPDEGCSDCESDCGCKTGEYCETANGVCYPADQCGNGICSNLEKTKRSCCRDCSCNSDELCNPYVNECQKTFDLSEDLLSNIQAKYTYYNLIKAEDTNYYTSPAKVLTFNCSSREGDCSYFVTVLENGTVANENMIRHKMS